MWRHVGTGRFYITLTLANGHDGRPSAADLAQTPNESGKAINSAWPIRQKQVNA